MKILLTGASGFIGRHVLQKLLGKYSARELVALSSEKLSGIHVIDSRNYTFKDDIFTSNGCSDIEVLLHMGAFTPKSKDFVSNLPLSNSNIINTQKIIFSRLPNLKKVIFLSTIDVYKPSELYNEETPTIPTTLYGWSKLYCEKMIEEYSQSRNLICNILRIGHVYGVGEYQYKKIIPTLIQKVINNESVELFGDGEALRTFIYIDDVSEAICKAIDFEGSGVTNIVGTEAITINNLVREICLIESKKIPVKYIHAESTNRNFIFDNTLFMKRFNPCLTKFYDGIRNEYYDIKKR